MKLTREEALKYHRQMWTDMQEKLGDKPRGDKRVLFKEKWCAEHFPNENIESSCFLCEYAKNADEVGCSGGQNCLVVWPYGSCIAHQYYYNAPISKILALPERGKWIIKDDTEKFIAQCNCCRYIEDSRRIKNYCPNCGAKMEVTE